MALSFLEPRIAPHGNTFLHCREHHPAVKRSLSFSGYMSHALRELSDLLPGRCERLDLEISRYQSNAATRPRTCHCLFPKDFRFRCNSGEVNISMHSPPCSEENGEKYVQVDNHVWPDTDDDDDDMDQGQSWRRQIMSQCTSDALDLASLSGDINYPPCQTHSSNNRDDEESLAWPDTDEEEDDMEQYERWRRASCTTWGSVASMCSTLSLATLIPEVTDKNHNQQAQHEQHNQLNACSENTADRALRRISVMGYNASSLESDTRSNCSASKEVPPVLLKDSLNKYRHGDSLVCESLEPVTTLMIRNLPPHVSQAGFLQELDTSGFKGSYNFAYVPQSFERKENQGFAFINFVSAAVAGKFVGEWHRQHRFNMKPKEPPINVSAATLQGLEANMQKWGGKRMRRIKNPEFRPFVLELNGKA